LALWENTQEWTFISVSFFKVLIDFFFTVQVPTSYVLVPSDAVYFKQGFTQNVKKYKQPNDIVRLRYRTKGDWAMENLILITRALALIEENLTEDIKTVDIAKELYCSKSSIEKLFKYATNMSIRDYIIRRRMSRAAKDIVVFSDVSFLELAFKYGYGSNEAFTRAFKNVWHVTPSEYRKNPMHFELFPAFKLEPELMEDEK